MQVKDKKNTIFLLFAAASIATGLAGGINDSVFNNFINSNFNITAQLRGLLELPRESPGFIVVLLAFSLFYFLGDLRLAMIANVIFAMGLFGIGNFAHSYPILCLWLFIASSGQHIYLPLSSAIAVSISDGKNDGKVLGKFSGISMAASIGGYGIVWLGFKYFNIGFKNVYTIGAVVLLISVVFFWMMRRNISVKPPKSRIVLKKRYSLFYILNVLYGARKQIFITFAPWVIVSKFHGSITYFAALGLFGNLLGVFFRPFVGRMIDKIGEKRILRMEAVTMIFVCSAYAFSGMFGGKGLYIASACYMVDQMMMSVVMARVMYVKKIAEVPEDVSPTVAMGVSMDHMVAMTMPFLGGFIWDTVGYWAVFAIGAAVSLLNAVFASRIKIPLKNEQLV